MLLYNLFLKKLLAKSSIKKTDNYSKKQLSPPHLYGFPYSCYVSKGLFLYFYNPSKTLAE